MPEAVPNHTDCLSKDDARNVVRSMLRHEGLVRHHIESYNKFITQHVPHIVAEKSTLVVDCLNVRHVVRFQDVFIAKPTVQEDDGCIRRVMPQECALRKQTYAASVYVNLLHVEEHKRVTPPAGPGEEPQVDWVPTKRRLYREVLLCTLPAMTRSVVCHTADEPDLNDLNSPYEYGGTFIISGGEKVLIPQEKLRINRVFVFKSTLPKYAMVAEIRSCHEDKLRSTSTLTVRMTDTSGVKVFWVFIPYIKKPNPRPVPLFAVCRLLGFRTMKEVARCVVTAGRSSGRAPLPKDSAWTSPAQRKLYFWILTVLKNETWAKMTALPKREEEEGNGGGGEGGGGGGGTGEGGGGGGAGERKGSGGNKGIPNFEAMTYEEIIEWVGLIGTQRPTKEERFKYVHHLMANEFLPHIGLTNTPAVLVRKRRFFAYMIYRLALCAIRPACRQLDDKDHYGNKQIETSGKLMSLGYRQNWRGFLRKYHNALKKEIKLNRPIVAGDLVPWKLISDHFKYCLATGKWGQKKAGSTQTGVSQPVKRMCHMTWLAHARRLNVPLNREGKNPKPRMLRFPSWGISCPATTPEGAPCGLIKCLALGALITLGVHSQAVANLVLHEVPAEDRFFPAGTVYDFDRGCLADDPRLARRACGSGSARNTQPSSQPSSQHPTQQSQPSTQPQTLDEAIAANDAALWAWGAEDSASLLINGIPFCVVRRPRAVVATVVDMRRRGHIPFDTSVVYDPQLAEIYVSCDEGGARRPVFIVPPDGDFGATLARTRAILRAYGPDDMEVWRQLLLQQCVEYLDKHEEEATAVVWGDPQAPMPPGGIVPSSASQPSHSPHTPSQPPSSQPPTTPTRYTHCEVHPLLIYGEATACIPFSNHNAGPRNTYQSSMGQAAIGVPGVELGMRTSAHRLFYPERPLVRSFVEGAMGLDALPAGQNITLAIFPHESNQEDSLVFNQAAVDAGLFRSFFYRTYTEEVQKSFGVDAEKFGKPDEYCTGLKAANYDKLEPNGFPRVGAVLADGDIVIGKQMAIHNMASADKHSMVMRDQSCPMKRFENPSVVDAVMRTSTGHDRKLVAVRTMSVRVPERGDKFASRCAQKGVIGRIVPDEDMPFSERTGQRPSVLMSPLTIPSRMTIGHLAEMLVGKRSALEGVPGDGSAHEGLGLAEVEAELRARGFTPSGKERMICGKTGRVLEAAVFTGPIFYQRLRQMVDDKYHARSRGQRQVMTRQATEGRAREGGFRLGEMERDCIAGNGCAYIMKDRFLEQSDDYITVVCAGCGLIAEPARAITSRRKRSMVRAARPYCRNCRTSEGVYKVRLPYNYKLLFQEVMGMGVAMRFELEEPMFERDLEACPSVGLHVPPDAEVTKPKRFRRTTTIQRDATLLTGAYSSLVQEDVDPSRAYFAGGAYREEEGLRDGMGVGLRDGMSGTGLRNGMSGAGLRDGMGGTARPPFSFSAGAYGN